MRNFRLPELPAVPGPVTLDADASHHLVRVLRARPGQQFLLLDDHGMQAKATFRSAEEGVAVLDMDEAPTPQPATDPLHLIVAVVKGSAMDDALRMATEIGATHIHPFRATRSIAKGDRQDRWQRILASATQQCRRAALPELLPTGDLTSALQATADVMHRYVAHPGSSNSPMREGSKALLIGPEGGLTEQEVSQALDAGFLPLSLGPWIQRAPTAVAVGLGLLTSR